MTQVTQELNKVRECLELSVTEYRGAHPVRAFLNSVEQFVICRGDIENVRQCLRAVESEHAFLVCGSPSPLRDALGMCILIGTTIITKELKEVQNGR